MKKRKAMREKIKKLKPSKSALIFILTGGAIYIGFSFQAYSSRFEAEAACNRSYLYCHHDKETRQILGLDYQETKDFKLGWPVLKRYRY